MFEDEELFDDLAYDEAEGMADVYDDFDVDDFDEWDEWDEGDEFDEFDEFDVEGFDEWDEEDEWDEFDEADEWDDYDEWDDFESDEEEAMEDAMAYALASEDTDEFFKKLFRGIKKVARKVAPVIGKVARVAGPILSKIPHPYAQAAGMAARLLGKLRAEGATEEEAMEAMAELAAKDKRAVPIVAGLAARSLIKSKGKRMSFRARKQVVKDVNKAAKILVKKRGKKAIRALPRIVKSVKRTAAVKRQPVKVRPKVVKKTAIKVVRSPRLVRKLSKPKPKAVRLVRIIKRTTAPTITAVPSVVRSGTRSYTLPGPTRITITSL